MTRTQRTVRAVVRAVVGLVLVALLPAWLVVGGMVLGVSGS